MTRRSKNLAARHAHFADHGGEMRFWLAWVFGEIEEDVRAWFRAEAERDSALEQDLESLDAPSARAEVRSALEATNYLAPALAAPSRLDAEEEDELTDLVMKEGRARAHRLSMSPRSRSLSDHELLSAALVGEPPAVAELRLRYHDRLVEQARRWLAPRHREGPEAEETVKQLWSDLTTRRGSWPRPAGPGVPVGRWLADALHARIRAHTARRSTRPLRRALPPLADAYDSPPTLCAPVGGGGAVFRLVPSASEPDLPGDSPGKREERGAVAQRVGNALFRLLEEVQVSLPPRDEIRHASQLLQHLTGPDALNHFHELSNWLRRARARMHLASHPALFSALDRLLTWLAPECFRIADSPAPQELSFRLFLRVRLKDHCYRQGWARSESEKIDLEKAFASLSRERIGEVMRAALRELADAEAEEVSGVDAQRALVLLRMAP